MFNSNNMLHYFLVVYFTLDTSSIVQITTNLEEGSKQVTESYCSGPRVLVSVTDILNFDIAQTCLTINIH